MSRPIINEQPGEGAASVRSPVVLDRRDRNRRVRDRHEKKSEPLKPNNKARPALALRSEVRVAAGEVCEPDGVESKQGKARGKSEVCATPLAGIEQ